MCGKSTPIALMYRLYPLFGGFFGLNDASSRPVKDRSQSAHHGIISPRLARRALRVLGGLFAAAVWLVGGSPVASAQGRLDAHYEATLAGIPVGKGSWAIEILDDQFSAAAQGGTSGLLKAFAGGSGTGAAQGRVVNGALVSTNYQATTTSSKKSEAIHMVLANGTIKEFGIDPEPPVDPDRVVVTDAHRRNVFDPMTGSMLRVPGTSDPLSPEACHTGAAIFDGRLRYDLKLDFKRMETVKAEKGYAGPVVVCAVYFTPGRRLHPRSPCDQISHRPAQHRNRLRACVGNPHPGPVPHGDPDAAGRGDAGSDAVHHDRDTAKGGEDAVRSPSSLLPLWEKVARSAG